MTDIDAIFKSNLNDSQKKARSIFGKLLISLRKNDYMKIYSLLGAVVDQNLKDNVITLVFSDNNSYLMLNNSGDIGDINLLLNNIQDGLKVELKCASEKNFDEYQFEQFLKEEFGKILTIKK